MNAIDGRVLFSSGKDREKLPGPLDTRTATWPALYHVTSRYTLRFSFEKEELRVDLARARNSAELVTLYEMKWTLNEKLHSSARKARPPLGRGPFARALVFSPNVAHATSHLQRIRYFHPRAAAFYIPFLSLPSCPVARL